MNGYRIYSGLGGWFVIFGVDWKLLKFINNIQAVNNSEKYIPKLLVEIFILTIFI